MRWRQSTYVVLCQRCELGHTEAMGVEVSWACMVGRCAGDGARAVIVGAEKRWCRRPCIVVVGAQRGEGCIVGRYAGVEIMREKSRICHNILFFCSRSLVAVSSSYAHPPLLMIGRPLCSYSLQLFSLLPPSSLEPPSSLDSPSSLSLVSLYLAITFRRVPAISSLHIILASSFPRSRSAALLVGPSLLSLSDPPLVPAKITREQRPKEVLPVGR